MKIFAIAFLFVIQAKATHLIQLENSWNLFTQKTGPGFTLPEPLSNRVQKVIRFNLPDADGVALRKVFSEVMAVNEFKLVIEIYYFNQNSQSYLSQQVFLYKAGKLVSRCTSYFGLEQKFLVPGSCAGVEGESLYGIAIYK